MQERIAAMEAAAMSEKDWFMRGETQAGEKVPKCRSWPNRRDLPSRHHLNRS